MQHEPYTDQPWLVCGHTALLFLLVSLVYFIGAVGSLLRYQRWDNFFGLMACIFAIVGVALIAFAKFLWERK